MEKVRFGIIGFGNMGSGHAENLTAGKVENGVLAAICDIKPGKRDFAKEKYPDVAIFENHTDLLKSGLVDAVIVATPHYVHTSIGIDAMRAGIAVMSEKPAGVYTKQVEEIIAVQKETGVPYGVMFNQRTNPMYIKMRELIQSGELGTLTRCAWIITDWYRTQNYYDSGDWRATWSGEGGGVLVNQCPHQLDLLQWICGMPRRIHAFCHEGHFHNIEVEDDVTAYLEFENGATGIFITTTGDAPGTNRFEVTGTGGKMIAEEKTLTFVKNLTDSKKNIDECPNGFGLPDTETFTYTFDTVGPQHVGVLNAFADHLVKGTPMIAEGHEGINGVAIANAMMLSSWKNDFVECKNDGEEFWIELQKRIATSRRKENVGEDKIADLSATYNSKSK